MAFSSPFICTWMPSRKSLVGANRTIHNSELERNRRAARRRSLLAPCDAVATKRSTRSALTRLHPSRRASQGNASTPAVCRSVKTCQFSPVSRYECFPSRKISHCVTTSLSTSLLKLPRYSSSLCDRLGGSKIERIFSVTSVSSWERGSKETTPDMKPLDMLRHAIRRRGT